LHHTQYPVVHRPAGSDLFEIREHPLDPEAALDLELGIDAALGRGVLLACLRPAISGRTVLAI
jgi:hypothetical protein